MRIWKLEKSHSKYICSGTIETAEGRSVRKSRQVIAKRVHLSFEGSVSQKKTRKKSEAKVLQQGASQSGLGSVESKEEEVAPPLIRSQRSEGPATSEGVEVVEGP